MPSAGEERETVQPQSNDHIKCTLLATTAIITENEGNPCRRGYSPELPWRSLQRSQALADGDGLAVRPSPRNRAPVFEFLSGFQDLRHALQHDVVCNVFQQELSNCWDGRQWRDRERRTLSMVVGFHYSWKNLHFVGRIRTPI